MNHVVSYFTGYNFSNYSILNETNIFNLLLNTFELIKGDEDKSRFIELIVIQCGNTMKDNFKQYVFRKISTHQILSFM
jgi:hypothetical protein